MDFSKIFLKDACPTGIGGQAIIEGVMMRGTGRIAMAMRVPDGRIHLKTNPLPAQKKWAKIPILRGIFAFVQSLSMGMKTLLYSADVAEAYDPARASKAESDTDIEGTITTDESKTGRISEFLTRRFGERTLWNLMIGFSVFIAIAISVLVFILLPTVVINFLDRRVHSHLILNLAEGVFRLILFILYILAISKMDDIHRTFEYHGAEHKTIHCFENGLTLTPDHAQDFYTLHPRCGTSFLMFVMIISILLFSLFGWPDLWLRLLSRILLIPLVAGLSYELLKWAGRSDNLLVRILSLPGLYLQKLTTAEPSKEQLEVAIVAMKAALAPSDTPFVEGIVDIDANLLETHIINENNREDAE